MLDASLWSNCQCICPNRRPFYKTQVNRIDEKIRTASSDARSDLLNNACGYVIRNEKKKNCNLMNYATK